MNKTILDIKIHYEQLSKAEKKIADYLMEEFEKNGYDVRGMIQDEIRKIEAREAREKALAKRNGKPLPRP